MNRRMYPRLMLWPVLLGLVLLVGPAWGQAVVYVDAGASGAGDGSSWADAFTSVQAGLNAAAAGDQVWVAAGRYVENITLANGVALYGGFAGDEDPATFDLAERDFGANETILDGNQAGSVVTAVDLADERTRVDGFTITNGLSTDGGGLYLIGSSATIANNTITGNRATSATYQGGGAGLYLSYCAATIANNRITRNSTNYRGGGLYLYECAAALTNNAIADNNGDSDGGGLHVHKCTATLTNNTITGNCARRGGALYLWSSPAVISNSTIAGNAGAEGGGLYLLGSAPTIANTIVAFNSAGVYRTSGTISTPIMRHNCVYGNAGFDYVGLDDPTGTDGNISADPLFADRAYSNWHIQPDSPCVDAGDNDYVFGEFDIDGEPRIQPVGGTVDIGADESDGTIWPAGPYVIVRVSPDGADDNDGSSWELAKRTVQAAIDVASELRGEVWVAAGTYYERITLLPYAYVYGGFAGTETERSERDWVANVTVLDGQQGGSVVTAEADHGVSALDGFTITNGQAQYGGGLYLWRSSPIIANNVITNNGATTGGGGLYLLYSCAMIVNNTVKDNMAGTFGGGMCFEYCSPTIGNNKITGNNTGGRGGGLYLGGSFAMMPNNTIAGNNAGSRGGGLYVSGSSPRIVNNTIVSNGGGTMGGGLSLESSAPTIANTIVAFNSSGIYRASGTSGMPIMRHNCVYGNAGFDYVGLDDPTGTDGNISADPLFADRAYGDWHIQPDSPCVDAGNNDFVFGEFDIDGEPRVHPIGGTVDIGADESDGTIWPAGPYVIVRVSTDGADDNDGSSWALAKRTVQAAIDVASELRGEVWVAGGRYHERITLLPYAYVYGGFAGTETERSQRDWVANVTVLDGQQAGSVVTAEAGHRVSALDGFTITNGQAQYGGGLYLWYSSPIIANNVITSNGATRDGGGLYLRGSSATIANNRIAANSAGSAGGGLYLRDSSPTVANNAIVRNRAQEIGGGLYVRSSSALITNNTIAANSADNEGGGIFLGNVYVTIANTIVAFNSSGIYRVAGYNDMPILRHNCVYGNAEYDYFGLDDPTGTDGNISEDPRFADAAYANWHIQPDSPCVDAGDNEYVGGELDMDGEPRVQPAGGTVDIGADESDGTIWAPGPQVVVRVSPEGDDNNDGSSWVLAKRTVQAATDVAFQFGGEVWVAAGTYYERITLRPYAYVYGGFAGTESEREQRDWVGNVTVLDGQQAGPVVTAQEGHGVSALDGFTITNGLSGYGGGLGLWYSSPIIANNVITGNKANLSGGGLYLWYSSATIVGNTVVGNRAENVGGGLCSVYSSPTITNNTIACNRARAGSLFCAHSSPTIASSIVAFNSSGIGRTGTGAPLLLHNCVYGNTAYDYSGLDDPTGTDGNISDDPLFVLTPGPGTDGAWGTEDDELGDARLSAGSPCIDAGDNAYVPEFVTTDLDGNPRFVDGSGDGVATVDMGAYEYQFRPGDLNCDGVVNSFDIDPFVLALTSAIDEPPFVGYLAVYPDCDPRLADVNGDGLVNVFDIDPFVAALTGGVGK